MLKNKTYNIITAVATADSYWLIIVVVIIISSNGGGAWCWTNWTKYMRPASKKAGLFFNTRHWTKQKICITTKTQLFILMASL